MNGEDDFLSALRRTDPWVAAITAERIESALEGFELPLAEGWDWARLANSIQEVATYARGEPPQGDAEAKAELEQLADKAEALRRSILRMGQTAELAAFWEAFRHRRDGEGAEQFDYENDFEPLMIHPLTTITNILARAASQIGTQRPQASRWRDRHRKELRVKLAVFLIPIFQSAYDTVARANNWRAEYGQEHPWPDFFRRIYLSLFPATKRLNLAEVLQEAARELPHVEAIKDWLNEQDAIRTEES